MSLANLFLDKPVEQTSTETRQYSLLLVDDEPNMLSALKRVFQHESYRVLTASSGPEALDILEREPVQLIISDHRMPLMTGAELLTTARSRWPDTMRIMLTGYADVQSIMGAITEGAVFKFITKPCQDDDLRITVARALEQYELRREVRALRTNNKRQEGRLRAYSSVFAEDRGTLLKIMLHGKQITPEEYERAVAEQRRSCRSAYQILLGTTTMSEEDIESALHEAMAGDIVDLREARISPEAAELLSPEFCHDNLVLPIRLDDNVLTLAMVDPSDILKRENLERLLGVRLNIVLAKGGELAQRIDQVYGSLENEEVTELFGEVDIVIEDEEKLDKSDVETLLRSSGVPPVVRIVNAILAEALRCGASDIHIEPRVKYTVIRFRVDGLLHDRMRLPSGIHRAVSSRIKVLAKVDIAERRKPQDGRITVRVSDRTVDLRVSTLPTLHGENIVLRLLDRCGVVRRIEATGLDTEKLDRIRALVRRPQGMVLCTGPTGSGKTTMLYSILHEHLDSASCYGTIEDPVEYYVESACQVHIRDKAELTFPAALRSMLRQDPDVVLVGEIRDGETAQIAFQAALTGHLVLSTVHTRNAVSTITRLVNLGVEPFLIASGLECVIAQRLLRRICHKCYRPAKPDPDVLRLLNLRPKEIGDTLKGVGCQHCNNTGYSGRLGVFEILEVTDRMRELVLASVCESEIAETARRNGMRTLFEDAMKKVEQGLTTFEEVLRVLGPCSGLGLSCEGCGAVLKPSFNACPLCGKIVCPACSKCGSHLIEEWSFCPSCGHICDKPLTKSLPISPVQANRNVVPGIANNLDPRRLSR